MAWKWATGAIILLVICGTSLHALCAEKTLPSQILSFAGKTYASVDDPEYAAYDQALRAHLVKRIKQRFGARLDSKIYSGFDLLEIEAFFACRKSSEPIEQFLKMFPRQP